MRDEICVNLRAVAEDRAQGFDPAKYPNLKGQWLRLGAGNGNAWDPTQAISRQSVPLIPEYQRPGVPGRCPIS